MPEDRIFTPYAGLALLLPALRALDPDGWRGPYWRHEVLVRALGGSDRVLARGDLGVRKLSGLVHDVAHDPPEDDWAAVLADVTERFRSGLKGMETASLAYLRKQFLLHSGVVTASATDIRVRINSIPMKVVLTLSGRLGEQGELPWHPGRTFTIDVGDG